jgi:hypothetical protein
MVIDAKETSDTGCIETIDCQKVTIATVTIMGTRDDLLGW